MIERSLSHTYVQNQQKTSWNDDPFDLKGSIAGVANMNHQRNLNDFALELVSNYAILKHDLYELELDNVPEIEQNELVRLYMEAHNRETSECVYGNDFTINSDYTCALLAMLQDDNQETRENFAEVTRKNIIIYYSEQLEDLLSKACDIFLENSMNEYGYFANLSLDHDESNWEKY